MPEFIRNLALTIEALVQASRTEVALRRRPVDRLVRELSRSPSAPSPHVIPSRESVPMFTLCHAVESAYRFLPFELTCLRRAIVLCRLRRRRGLPALLRIGVRKREGRFEAHAWVEDDRGITLTDPLEEFVDILPSEVARL